MIQHSEGKYKIIIEENIPRSGAKSKFGFILNPLGRKNVQACLYKGCKNATRNKNGLCARGGHKIEYDLLLRVEDVKGNRMETPKTIDCIKAIREYEKNFNDENFLPLIKRVARLYIGERLPPYSIYKRQLTGYYDLKGILKSFPIVSESDYLKAFQEIKDELFAIYPNEQENFTYEMPNGTKYSYRLYKIVFLWLILVEEINRGDRWLAIKCYEDSTISKFAGGALPILNYWMYHFPWGDDRATGNVRIPLSVKY